MQLIPFEENNAPEIVSWFDSEHEAMMWGGRALGWPLTAQALCERTRRQDLRCYVLTHQQQLLGFIELKAISADEYRLCRVVVAKQSRGQGYGKTLVSNALDILRQQVKVKRVTLAVYQANPAALNCYLALGFYITDQGPKFKRYKGKNWWLHQMEIAM
ncbi:GNAT family N-acetyltransferase [Vibrio sp.]|uniref:GNAT family N-acetyltransferase n=1 Tax=Vibrio sp. TaxID=678 RepID=UPI003D0E190C